jgi:putative transposase
MGRAKKHSPEQIVNLLRQIEVGIANGKTHPIACGKSKSWSRRITAGARSTAV